MTSTGAPADAPTPDIEDDDETPQRQRRRFLGLDWLREYQASWLRWDVIAGVTLAAYLLPSAIAYASIANLPVQAGLYACLFSGLVYWLFCSSRLTSITPTSAISLLIGSSLAPLAAGDASRFGALAACATLMVGVLAAAAWAVRAGAVSNFISETVMIGFKTGVALDLGSTQLPKLLGMKGGPGDFWERSWSLLTRLGETNRESLYIGLAALVLLVLGGVFLKNRPVSLFVVAGAIVAAGMLHLGERGVKMLGELPQGLPPVSVPVVSRADVNQLLPLAMACFLLAAVETAALGRMFATATKRKVDVNRELLAIGAANVASGLGGGFPVSGGMSQSLVNQGGGAKTPLSTFVASVLIFVVTVFFSGALRDLPQPVLAAIVLVSVTGLFKFAELKHLWRTARGEFAVAFTALLGVLGSGLLDGVLIGVVLSIGLLLIRASRPHVAFLGRIPGNRRFSDLARHEDNVPVPGAVIVRPEVSLLYFNTAHIHSRVMERVRGSKPRPRLVLFDLSACPHIDTAGTAMLSEIHEELTAEGVRLQVVEARAKVRDALRLQGVEEKVGRIDRFTSVADAVEAFEAAPPAEPSVP